MKFTKIHLSALALITVTAAAQADPASEAILLQGKAAYISYCARCHGDEAKGDGPDAKRVNVTPRDLTSGRFKFKTTVSGTPPSDADLQMILKHGLAGSGMPSFANMETETKNSIIAYLKSISPAYANNIKPEPIKAPDTKARVDLKKGAEIYAKLQCGKCHGDSGRANGPSSPTLVDAWNRPIKAANLTEGWTYRAGNSATDIYYRVFAGLDGAPMPSYAEAITPEEGWQLANYVKSLQLQARWQYELIATSVKGDLPSSADDAAWEKATRTDLNLQGHYFDRGKRELFTVTAISVQALRNDKEAAFRLEWNDPVKSEGGASDGIIVALKPADYAGDPRGNLHNLYAADAPPLDLIVWQASQPTQVGEKTSTLAAVGRAANSHQSSATAEFKDGRWTLVFKRDASTLRQGLPVSFGVWDGNNGESWSKFPASQWISLVSDAEPKQHP